MRSAINQPKPSTGIRLVATQTSIAFAMQARQPPGFGNRTLTSPRTPTAPWYIRAAKCSSAFSDGKARFCVWFRDANDELVVESFTMPAASDALADAEPEAWAMKRDLAKAFLQLQAHPADIELLGFVNPITGQVMLFTVPMFGLKSAPRCLHITVQAMCRATAVVARALGLLLMETNPALGEELYAAASRLRAYADDHFWASLPFSATTLHVLTVLMGVLFGADFDPAKDTFGRIMEVESLASSPTPLELRKLFPPSGRQG